MDFGSTTIFVGGVGFGLPAEVVNSRPTGEYVAGGTGLYSPNLKRVLPRSIDDVTADFGSLTYEVMLGTDPTVAAAFYTLTSTVLSDGHSLRPAMMTKPGAEPTPEELLSLEVCEFCERLVKRLPFDDYLEQFLLALALGNRLAEKVYEVDTLGIDANKLVWRAWKFKPRWSWAFVVDAYMTHVGILAYTPMGGPAVVVDPEKFILYTWRPKDGDPRGKSVLRAAYNAWNVKNQVWPSYFKYLSLFATPTLVGMVGEGAQPRPARPDDPIASLNADGMIEPETDLLNAITGVQAGTALAIPYGAKIDALNPTGNGESYREAIKTFDAQIARAIVLSERVVMEALHSSKADGEKVQDALGNLVRQIRRTLAWTIYRQGFYHAVFFFNDTATTEIYTPIFCLGETEHQDWAKVAGAVAVLQRAGYFTPSQLPAVDARLGLPIREPGETPEGEAAEDPETEDAEGEASENADGDDTEGDESDAG